MFRSIGAAFAVVWLCTPLLAQTLDHNVLPCPTPRGFALTDDLVGLVVSAPETTQLVYFNTSTEKELKCVELEFKPGNLCRQGKVLYVAGEGTAIVYAIDQTTGKTLKEYELGGDAIANLACHPREGLIYAATAGRAVFSIDPVTGKVTKTSAIGKYIGVTAEGANVITGFQPGDGEYDYKASDTKRIVIPWDGTWGTRAQIVKYNVKGAGLEFEAAQNNAASNGWSFHLSPDGKRVAMPGGGGWRPAEGTGGGYVTAVFGTSNLQTMLAQAPSAIGIAFHPVLDLGATSHDDGVRFFRAKSLKPAGEFKMKGNGSSALLAAAAKGTKFIFWNGTGPGKGLHFLPLELSADDRAQLTKVYGTLPEPVAVEEAVAKLAEPEPGKPTPTKTKPESPNVAKTPGKTPPRMERKPGPPSRVAASSSAVKKPTGPVEATAGFNDAKGVNADQKKFSPYPLGVFGEQPGQGEPGWGSNWRVGDKITYQKEVVYEGDGAAFLTGTTAAVRSLAVPFRGRLEVEQFIRLPAGGDVKAYISKEENATGPMWMAFDGKFYVIDGNGEQFAQQNSVVADVPCKPDTWYKVTVKIDVPSRTYEVFIDDKKVEHAQFKFRGKADAIAELRYLTEKPEGVFLDAVRVSPLPDESKQR
jgi:hypothetical protein